MPPPGPLAADDDPIYGRRRRANGHRREYNIEVLTPAECEAMPPRAYVIKGLLSVGDHGILLGHPGSGKSLLAPYLGYAVAQGRAVLGRRVQAGPVLYIAAEDGRGMAARVRALRRRWGDAPDFHLVPVALDLLDPDSEQLAALLAYVAEFRPLLIVIDTLSKSFAGLRENDAEDMSRVVSVVRELAAAASDAAVLTVHHVPKDAGTTPRGHGALNGDADATIFVEGSGRETRTVRLGKNRSGSSDATFTFAIGFEDFGLDADGDPITAPIAEEAEASVAASNRAREAKLRDGPAVLLREIRNLLAEAGERVSPGPGIPVSICIERGLLRGRLVASGWFSEGLLRTASNGEVGLERAAYATENHG